MPRAHSLIVLIAGLALFVFGLSRADSAAIFWLCHVGLTAVIYAVACLFDPFKE